MADPVRGAGAGLAFDDEGAWAANDDEKDAAAGIGALSGVSGVTSSVGVADALLAGVTGRAGVAPLISDVPEIPGGDGEVTAGAGISISAARSFEVVVGEVSVSGGTLVFLGSPLVLPASPPVRPRPDICGCACAGLAATSEASASRTAVSGAAAEAAEGIAAGCTMTVVGDGTVCCIATGANGATVSVAAGDGVGFTALAVLPVVVFGATDAGWDGSTGAGIASCEAISDCAGSGSPGPDGASVKPGIGPEDGLDFTAEASSASAAESGAEDSNGGTRLIAGVVAADASPCVFAACASASGDEAGSLAAPSSASKAAKGESTPSVAIAGASVAVPAEAATTDISDEAGSSGMSEHKKDEDRLPPVSAGTWLGRQRILRIGSQDGLQTPGQSLTICFSYNFPIGYVLHQPVFRRNLPMGGGKKHRANIWRAELASMARDLKPLRQHRHSRRALKANLMIKLTFSNPDLAATRQKSPGARGVLPRAPFDLVESDRRSRSLFCRSSLSKKWNHFLGKRSRRGSGRLTATTGVVACR